MENGSVFGVRDKTAIVTGASSGLGVTFAEALADAGATVVLAARRYDRLEAVAQRIDDAGGEALPVRCDVGDASQVSNLFRRAEARFGRPDIVVNNAGVVADGDMVPEKVKHDKFEETVRTNLLGVWYCCREAGARMLADGNGGSIINIASIAGVAGGRDYAPAYVATKAAVINLTRTLACSWSDRGVRVNGIAPGWFPSEITDPLFELDSFKRWAAEAAPMGRIGRVEELIGPLLFFASEASSFVTGQTLVVDGGLTAGAGRLSYPDELYESLAGQEHGLGLHIRPPG